MTGTKSLDFLDPLTLVNKPRDERGICSFILCGAGVHRNTTARSRLSQFFPLVVLKIQMYPRYPVNTLSTMQFRALRIPRVKVTFAAI